MMNMSALVRIKLGAIAVMAGLLGANAANAATKDGSFMAFYMFDNQSIRPGITRRLTGQCLEDKKNTPEICGKNVNQITESLTGYMAYRMTTEKSWDYFKHMVDCGKLSPMPATCSDVTDYITQLEQDFFTEQKMMQQYIHQYYEAKSSK